MSECSGADVVVTSAPTSRPSLVGALPVVLEVLGPLAVPPRHLVETATFGAGLGGRSRLVPSPTCAQPRAGRERENRSRREPGMAGDSLRRARNGLLATERCRRRARRAGPGCRGRRRRPQSQSVRPCRGRYRRSDSTGLRGRKPGEDIGPRAAEPVVVWREVPGNTGTTGSICGRTRVKE